MKYLDGSFSISLRAWDSLWGIKAKSRYNLTHTAQFDNIMKKNFKNRYMDWKEKLAIKPADKALAAGNPQ
jgi:hypothetical protein